MAPYKTYVDIITDMQPEMPFYVGKGNDARISFLERNKLHAQACATHAFERRIVFETNDEQAALAREVELIALHHTFVGDPLYNGVGCNKTRGGGGTSGWRHTDATKLNIRRKCSGRRHTAQEVEKQVAKQTGRRMLPEHRQARSALPPR